VRPAAAVVEREPVVTGKPSPFLVTDIIARHGCLPGRMVMVGDRLDTDMLWGNTAGMRSLLVMTGVTDDAVLQQSNIKPHFVVDSLGDLRALAEVPGLMRRRPG
jgi:ribonucleotide monophosphatase NagD (HAD superfamily)